MTDIKAVVFDIDGTLTKAVSWYVLTEKLGAPIEEHRKIYEARKTGELDGMMAKQKILELWRTKGDVSKGKLEKIFWGIPLREETHDVMDYLKKQGYTLCLITGSIDLYAAIIAERLGIKDYFANTELVWDTSDNLIDFDYKVKQAKQKLVQFKEWSERLGLEPQQCAVVGDSWNDHDLFTYTGRGIAVKTEFEEPELEKVAWKIISRLSELKDIL